MIRQGADPLHNFGISEKLFVFKQTHNRDLGRLFLTVSWDCCALKGTVISPKKPFQGSETETTEVAGGNGRERCFPNMGSLLCPTEANQREFTDLAPKIFDSLRPPSWYSSMGWRWETRKKIRNWSRKYNWKFPLYNVKKTLVTLWQKKVPERWVKSTFQQWLLNLWLIRIRVL